MFSGRLSVPEPLADKIALVSGATGFLGVAFCEALLEGGAQVVCLGRNAEKVGALKERLGAEFSPERVHAFTVDCANDEAFRDALLAAEDISGRVDVLVNNAFDFSRETGFNHPSGAVDEMSRSQWLRGLESGVYWPASAVQVLGPGMKRRRRGSIINISSMYARVAPDPGLYEGRAVFNPPSYATVKAALGGFTRYVASFYGPFGVRCNALLPGAFPNSDPDAYNSPGDQELLDDLAQRTVLGRVGQPEDLKGPLLFLASDASAYVTGQELVVDGGWTVR